MILVDRSAWIEFQRATGSPADLRLKQALEAEEPLAVVGLVILEVLVRARDDSHAERLNRLLSRCKLLTLEEPSDYEWQPRSIERAVVQGSPFSGCQTA